MTRQDHASGFVDFEEVEAKGGKFGPLRSYLLRVVVPCAVITGACVLFTAPRYTAEFEFSVTDAAKGGAADAASTAEVVNYLKSPAAVAVLAQRVGLAALYKGHGLDPVTNFWWDDGTSDSLMRYWNHHAIAIQSSNGAALVRVEAFSAQDSTSIAGALVDLGNGLVNSQSSAAVQAQAQQIEGAAARQDGEIATATEQLAKLRVAMNSVDPSQEILAKENLRAGLLAQQQGNGAALAAVRTRFAANAPAVQSLALEQTRLGAQIDALADPNAVSAMARYDSALQNLADARALDVDLHKDAIEAGLAASNPPLALTAFVTPAATADNNLGFFALVGILSFGLLNLLFAFSARLKKFATA